jgi:hypothetical protein
MAIRYTNAKEVTAPRRRWSLIDVLEDEGVAGGGVLALGLWDNGAVLAMRWNGSSTRPVGSPQSRGLATWFIVPKRYARKIAEQLPPDKRALVSSIIRDL